MPTILSIPTEVRELIYKYVLEDLFLTPECLIHINFNPRDYDDDPNSDREVPDEDQASVKNEASLDSIFRIQVHRGVKFPSVDKLAGLSLLFSCHQVFQELWPLATTTMPFFLHVRVNIDGHRELELLSTDHRAQVRVIILETSHFATVRTKEYAYFSRILPSLQSIVVVESLPITMDKITADEHSLHWKEEGPAKVRDAFDTTKNSTLRQLIQVEFDNNCDVVAEVYSSGQQPVLEQRRYFSTMRSRYRSLCAVVNISGSKGNCDISIELPAEFRDILKSPAQWLGLECYCDLCIGIDDGTP